MKPSLVVAMSRNGVIGRDGGLPWGSIHEDMANFYRITKGGSVVMGRKTWHSLPNPLRNRNNIVLSRSLDVDVVVEWATGSRAVVVRTPEEALEDASWFIGGVFIIGGGEIYRLFLPLCDEAHVTMIDRDVEGDVFFPDMDAFRGWDVRTSRPLADGVVYTHYVRSGA